MPQQFIITTDQVLEVNLYRHTFGAWFADDYVISGVLHSYKQCFDSRPCFVVVSVTLVPVLVAMLPRSEVV